jgi:hypothetical protein
MGRADMTGENFDEATLMEVAACLWEAALDAFPLLPAAQNEREENGTRALRMEVIGLAREAETAWRAMPEDYRDAHAFDWEFCPSWLYLRKGWVSIDAAGNASPA